MRKKGISVWWIASIAVLIVIFSALAGFFYLRGIPSIEEQISPRSEPIQVSILNPLNGSHWPRNYPIPVQVSAWAGAPFEQLDLMVNGQLYNSLSPLYDTNNHFEGEWHWQPGETGTYVLTVSALDASGASGISLPVIVTAGSDHHTVSPVYAEEGNTLATLAESNGIPVEKLISFNPGMESDQELAPQDAVFIPNDPMEISNKNVIPPLEDLQPGELSGETPETGSEKQPGWGHASPVSWSWQDNLKFHWDINGKEEAVPLEEEESGQVTEVGHLPLAPTLYSFYSGCTTQVSIGTGVYADFRYDPEWEYASDPLTNEDGFFIYRSRDGGEYERVAVLPAYKDEEDTSAWVFQEEDQFGKVVYYASAFNEFGENAGNPVVISLNQAECADPALMEDPYSIRVNPKGDLILPLNLDTAYLYIQVGDSTAVRVPEGDRFFLPNSGVPFNLHEYFDNISGQLPSPDIEADLEVWGWLGGQLVYAGEYHYSLHRSVLSVCSTEGEGTCSAGIGEWTDEMTILSDAVKPLRDQKYELRWRSTALSEVQKICLSITPKGYYGSGLRDSSSILLFECYYPKSGSEKSPNEGFYTLDFGRLLYPEDTSNIPTDPTPGKNFQDIDFQNRYPPGTPFTLHIRFLPALESSVYQDVSNTALMHYDTPYAPPDGPPLASEYPSMYEIEILKDTYKPPQYEIWNRWACVIVDEDPSGKYSPGQEVCPISYVECGVNVDCKGFWDVLGAGWDFVVNLISDFKGEISGKIAETIPGCSESAACRSVIKKGVDYGAFAISGIPPDLPNFNELAAQGAAEFIVGGLAGISGEEITYICGDSCKHEIAAQLQPYIEQAKSYYSQPGCMDMGAHYGMFPFCFPPPMKVHPVKGAYDYPAFVMVRVTRKDSPDSVNADPDITQGKIQLVVNGIGKNDQRIGYFGKKCYYTDNIPQSGIEDPDRPDAAANFWFFDFGENPMEEPLYHQESIPIPWLNPGESIDMPVNLKQIGYFVEPNCVQTVKNQYLFFRGTSHLTAEEYCFSSDSSWSWVPCMEGSSDEWEFENPQGP